MEEETEIETEITNVTIKDEIKETYKELLNEVIENDFYKKTLEHITGAVSNLDISGEKQSEALIGFYSQLTSDTMTKVFDQSILLVERSYKLPKELDKLDKDLDIATEQENELKQSVEDRKAKRPVEIENLKKQGILIDVQTAKMVEDKFYVIAQKESMIEQVGHNKVIKAMDSMGDMIGTLGNGGLKPHTKMFRVFFELNNKLTEVAIPEDADLTVAKI